MQINTALSALLMGFSAMASAEMGFGSMQESYNVGELVKVPYWTDQEYEGLEMQLVMLFNGGPLQWSSYDIMLSTDTNPAGNHTFGGYKMRDAIDDHKYAIWMTAMDEGTPATGGKTTGYAVLSEPFEIHNTGHKVDDDECKIVEATAGATVGGLVLGVLTSVVLFFIVRRVRAAKRHRAMIPVEWRDSFDSAAAEKGRMRVAMRETST